MTPLTARSQKEDLKTKAKQRQSMAPTTSASKHDEVDNNDDYKSHNRRHTFGQIVHAEGEESESANSTPVKQ